MPLQLTKPMKPPQPLQPMNLPQPMKPSLLTEPVQPMNRVPSNNRNTLFNLQLQNDMTITLQGADTPVVRVSSLRVDGTVAGDTLVRAGAQVARVAPVAWVSQEFVISAKYVKNCCKNRYGNDEKVRSYISHKTTLTFRCDENPFRTKSTCAINSTRYVRISYAPPTNSNVHRRGASHESQ